eukprot:gene23717-32097_t
MKTLVQEASLRVWSHKGVVRRPEYHLPADPTGLDHPAHDHRRDPSAPRLPDGEQQEMFVRKLLDMLNADVVVCRAGSCVIYGLKDGPTLLKRRLDLIVATGRAQSREISRDSPSLRCLHSELKSVRGEIEVSHIFSLSASLVARRRSWTGRSLWKKVLPPLRTVSRHDLHSAAGMPLNARGVRNVNLGLSTISAAKFGSIPEVVISRKLEKNSDISFGIATTI